MMLPADLLNEKQATIAQQEKRIIELERVVSEQLEDFQKLRSDYHDQAEQLAAAQNCANRWDYALQHGFWCADNPNVKAYSKGGLMLTFRIYPINKEGFVAAIDEAMKGGN